MWAGSIPWRDRCSWNLAAALWSRGVLDQDRWEPRKRPKQLAPISAQASTAFQIPPAKETQCWQLGSANDSLLKWPQSLPWMLTWAPMYFLFRRCFCVRALFPSAFCFPASSASQSSSLSLFLLPLVFVAMVEPRGYVVWIWCSVRHVFHCAKFSCHKLFKVRLVFSCIPSGGKQPVSALPGCYHSLVSGSGDASCWEAKWPPVTRLTPQCFEF